VLSSKEFGEFAKEFVVLAHVTTQIKDRKDDDLLGKKGGRGFPYLVALDAQGDVIAKLKGGRTIEGFRAMMADGAKFVEVRGKPKKTLDDEIFLLGHDIAMGNADLEKAKARAAALKGLNDAQKKQIDGQILGLEIQAAMPRGAKSAEEAKPRMLAAGKTFAEWWAKGREPVSEEAIGNFYSLILDHAEAQKDAALFEKALGKLRDQFGSNAQAAGFFKKQEERLAALKGEGSGDKKEPAPGPEKGDK
jgi:hypothetical protein